MDRYINTSAQTGQPDPHMSQRDMLHKSLLEKIDAHNPEAALETLIHQNEQLRKVLESKLGEVVMAVQELQTQLTELVKDRVEVEPKYTDLET